MAFKDVIGQDRAIAILRATLERERVPSAYLFSGESGIGKRLTACNAAKALNCLHAAPGDDSCDVCTSCRKIDNGKHPDVVVIEPQKGEIRVDEIRTIEEALSLKPFEGKRKIIIVDDAETMNQSAANAFLKTLEEPPDESLLILVTAHPDMLPETIRSRCSRLPFMPLSPGACERVIEKQETQKKGSGFPTASERQVLVRLLMGRPGLAYSSDFIREREQFLQIFQNMLKGSTEAWTDREEMEQWFDLVCTIIRDMVVCKIFKETHGKGVSSSDEMVLNADRAEFISELAHVADIPHLIETYTVLSFLRSRLDFNLNRAITWNYTGSLLRRLLRGAKHA